MRDFSHVSPTNAALRHTAPPCRDLHVEQDLADALAGHSRVIVSEDGATYAYQSAVPVGGLPLRLGAGSGRRQGGACVSSNM